MYMKSGKFFFVLSLTIIIFTSCNDTNSSKTLSKDTSEKKFDPAGEQKHGDTYDPKQTATDTMYKNRDSIPK
ncbi:MAG: hypothetical protein JWP81_2348 [Ferruginibacter sp.]|nr:hypothetical protein [Ferruginibacter sp.]